MTQEVEADVDGVLLQIVVPEGEVEVGSTVAVIGEDGEGAGAAKQEAPAEAEEAEPASENGAAAGQGPDAPVDEAGDPALGDPPALGQHLDPQLDHLRLRRPLDELARRPGQRPPRSPLGRLGHGGEDFSAIIRMLRGEAADNKPL